MQSGNHFELSDCDETIETMRISAGIIDFITMKSIILKNTDTRSIIEEGLKALEDGSCKRRLLDILIVVRVRIQDESATEVEKHRVIVKLVVSELDISYQDKHKPKYHLQVREKEDYEDESFEIQLPIGTDTQRITDC